MAYCRLLEDLFIRPPGMDEFRDRLQGGTAKQFSAGRRTVVGAIVTTVDVCDWDRPQRGKYPAELLYWRGGLKILVFAR